MISGPMKDITNFAAFGGMETGILGGKVGLVV